MRQETEIRVLIIYTGGTIGMIENNQTGALENFGLEKFRALIPELDNMGYNVDIIAFAPPIDSSDMSPYEWVEIARLITRYYYKYDGFVVLHGTDTMAYTASALSFMLRNLQKPVILTGSQLPIGKLRTDGKENLLTSVEIAAAKTEEGEAMVPEVCVYFDSELLRGNRTTKINSEGFNAFRSYNYPVLAKAGIKIKYQRHAILKRDKKLPFCPTFSLNKQVMALTIFPGIMQEYVETLLTMKNMKALMIKTYGAGNAPQQYWLIDVLRKLTDRGVIIVNNTQCNKGGVEMSLYKTGQQLLGAGVINGHDSTTEATITKLMVLLGENSQRSAVVRKMNEDLCGEVSILQK